MPNDRQKDTMYGSFVCNVPNEKAEKNGTHFVVGGDRINYPGEVAMPTVDMLLAKLLFNSVISKRGAKFMTMYISNFYLMMPLKRLEYIHIIIKDIAEEIIREYKLREKSDKSTLSQISGCMYYHSQDYSPTSYWKRDSTRGAIVKAS